MSRAWLSTFAPPEASEHPPNCPQYKAAPLDLIPKCASCNATGANKKCAGCKTLLYCNEQCQTDDWKLHKLVCKPYVDFIANNPRPANQSSGSFQLGIFLPPMTSKPKFFWFESAPDISPHLINSSIPNPRTIGKFLGMEAITIGAMLNIITLELLENFPDDERYLASRQLEMCSLPIDLVLKHNTPLNKCANELASNRLTFGWRGPMIVTQRNNRTGLLGDIEPSDLRTISDFFCRYIPTGRIAAFTRVSFEGWNAETRGMEELRLERLRTAPTVSAVIVRCDGGTRILKRPKYQNMEIPITDEIFLSRETQCSKALGIPLVICPSDETYDEFLGQNHALASQLANTLVAHRNEEVPFFYLTVDPDDESWGGLSPNAVAQCPQFVVGTVLVSRLDRKPITSRQVEVIANYFRRVVYPGMGNLIHQYEDGKPSVDEKNSVTKNLLNKEAFERYLEDFKKTKVLAGDLAWSTTTSPFNV